MSGASRLRWEAVRAGRDGALTMGCMDNDDEWSEVLEMSGTYVIIGVSRSEDVSGEFGMYSTACPAAAELVRDEVGGKVAY